MKKLTTMIAILAISLTVMPSVTAKITYQDTIGSVIQIWVQDTKGEWYTGSGVNISSDFTILTAAHVIMDETTGKPSEIIDICPIVDEYSIPNCKYAGKVLAYDTDIDLALIYPYSEMDENGNLIGEEITTEKAKEIMQPYVDISDYQPMLGDNMKILGFPVATNSQTITFTEGTISNFIPIDETGETVGTAYYVTDATINPGNSGGPAYNDDERLIGIVVQVSTEGVGGNYGYIVSADMIYYWFWTLVDQGLLNKDFVEQAFSNDYGTDNPLESNDIFTDVTYETPNGTAIQFLKDNNIVSGYEDGSFKPFNPLNRAELLKILVEGAGYSPGNEYANCFSDVKTDWYAKYVCCAKENKWISGYPDGTFKPSNNVNKAEALKMLLEVFGTEINEPTSNPYADVDANAWFAKYVSTAKLLGILEETGSEYQPQKYITRGQISENIYRLLVLLAQ